MSSDSSRCIKSFYIENLGCAKNQVDAEDIIASLEASGYLHGSDPGTADCIIVNTCGFIQPAKEESIDTSLAFRRDYPDKKIILAGCLAQRYGSQLDFPEVDAVFGNRSPARIGEILAVLNKNPERPLPPEQRVFLPDGPSAAPGLIPPYIRRPKLSLPGSAYVKIAEGCDNCCTFCAIPLIRGQARSRDIKEILEEIRGLVSRGIREINLVAQDLAAYGVDCGGASRLPELLSAICCIPGGFWVRMLYIHPDKFPLAILDVMERDPRILPYFDIPFQHGSVPVLKAMGRKGTMRSYLKLVRGIRNRFPDAVFRSTFLLGFPGETQADLEALAGFQQQLCLEWVGFFLYSREDDTPAAQISEGGIFPCLRRAARMRRARKFKSVFEAGQQEITFSCMDRYPGKELILLVEEKIEGTELFFARAFFQAPEVDGVCVLHVNAEQHPEAANLSPGCFVRAKVLRRNCMDLEAEYLCGTDYP